MSNPQQPELARSRKTPAQDQDAVAAVVEGRRQPGAGGPTGPVPAENQPGHHPAKEQDKPDLDAFAAKLGVAGDAVPENGAAPGERDAGPQAAATRATVIGVAGAVATLVAVVLAVVAGRRRRSRRRSR
jgi:hypothetical protein